MSLIDQMYAAAIASLRRCCTPDGVRASAGRKGHTQVWTRDAMIALLGGSLAEDAVINDALVASVGLLRSRAAANGQIPNNVDSLSLRPNFRAYADSGLWWILGAGISAPDPATTARILDWYNCQDVDQSGLLSMQESADWQDLFCTRGKGLTLNCLYVLALQAAGRHEHAQLVRKRINHFFWYRGDGNLLPHILHTFSTENVTGLDSLGRRRWLPAKQSLVEEQYYLPWLGFRACGEWFDTLGHCLAILSGVASPMQSERILDFIRRHHLADHPAIALHPQIHPGDPDWRDYYGMLNQPGQYHNGGIWPFIGGFYVAALVHCGQFREAQDALERLARLNHQGGFNEWHHGNTAEPLGVPDQAWSSGMYLFACHCVRSKKAIYFN
ncbi:MAG: amylo-alpha-1,6-glucosidase [Bryobacteraceae bacterium]|nr:amylo-alpha-1,6-glucosidase [Bryobacteraceae bacterium]